MLIKLIPTAIADVTVIQPRGYSDDRGWFFESFNERDFAAAMGQQVTFVQDNHSFSKKGVLRGLHYQMEQPQGKLVRVCHGSVFDVAVDLRKTSLTFGEWVGVELSADNRKQHWIPPGFAHGYLVLSDEAECIYKTTDYWHAASEQCLMWNDPTINIRWPDIGMAPILNAKDQSGFSWQDAAKF